MIIEDSMVSLAKRYTKLEFHEKTKRYYGTCPFCHSGADMFCADNKNGSSGVMPAESMAIWMTLRS